ncbi:MAG: DUF6273 domain-containing protein [Lachnospiraceae bacterium]|nr:DUF6273 domain-containing protein [Lachnospiraceae bacterium]
MKYCVITGTVLLLLLIVFISTFSGREAEVGKIIKFGGEKWLVLDIKDGKALLLSEKILENKKYHPPGGAVTWEESEIRKYLNELYYETTFTARERNKIAENYITNSVNPQWDTEGGSKTVDKIFLLSISEVEHYFDLGRERSAKCRNTGKYNLWWLRSPGELANYAALVHRGGYISVHGQSVCSTAGIRPALWVYF